VRGEPVSGDRVIRFATAAVVCAVAAFAAVVSYSHIYGLGRAHGQDGTAARLLPLSVDGLILAASLVLLHEARNGRDAPRLARLMLWLGIGATVGANIAFGAGYGLLGALISAWPAVAFIGSVEIAMQQVRRARAPRLATTGRVVPGDVEQAVRAAYAASVAAGQPLSQRAMAERFGLSRRKVSQLVTSVRAESNGHTLAGTGV
jgi:DNA-binding transcriptional regulator YdaS (Cro superfamily)